MCSRDVGMPWEPTTMVGMILKAFEMYRSLFNGFFRDFRLSSFLSEMALELFGAKYCYLIWLWTKIEDLRSAVTPQVSIETFCPFCFFESGFVKYIFAAFVFISPRVASSEPQSFWNKPLQLCGYHSVPLKYYSYSFF